MAYVGLARAFRGRIEAAVTVAIKIVRDTSQQLIARQRRHPVQRRDTLASIARAWGDKVPAFGRANQEIRLEGKEADWDEDAREPGLSVVRITLAIAPHEKLALGMHTLCAASLHALARRYQRGRPTTDDAIIADLHALAAAHERLRGLPRATASPSMWPAASGSATRSISAATTAAGYSACPMFGRSSRPEPVIEATCTQTSTCQPPLLSRHVPNARL